MSLEKVAPAQTACSVSISTVLIAFFLEKHAAAERMNDLMIYDDFYFVRNNLKTKYLMLIC